MFKPAGGYKNSEISNPPLFIFAFYNECQHHAVLFLFCFAVEFSCTQGPNKTAVGKFTMKPQRLKPGLVILGELALWGKQPASDFYFLQT